MSTEFYQVLGDVILAVAGIIFPAVIVYFTKAYKERTKTGLDYQQDKDKIAKIDELVSIGVTLAEKAGVTDKLTGSQQFKKAIKFVTESLDRLGITDYDLQELQGKIEHTWSQQKDYLESAYGVSDADNNNSQENEEQSQPK